MKDYCKQTVVILTTSKIGIHVMVWVVTRYGKWCLATIRYPLIGMPVDSGYESVNHMTSPLWVNKKRNIKM